MRFTSYVAIALAGILTALAAVHLAWALGAKSPGTATVPTRGDGQLVFRPGRAATFAVAALLLFAAVILLGDVGILAPIGPRILYRVGVWWIGAVFLLRAIGDFRYVGIFKRERATRFAQLDSRIYTPLCVALAVGTFYVAAA